MPEENKNKKPENQKKSSVENDELTIAPISEEGAGISITPQGGEEKVAEDKQDSLNMQTQPQQEQSQPQLQSEPQEAKKGVEVVAKPKKEEETDVFDMQLENMSKEVKQNKNDEIIKSEEKPLQVFIFKKKKRGSIAESLVATIAFLLFSGIIFTAGVFADISYDEYKSEFAHTGITQISDVPMDLTEGAVVDTSGEDGAVLLIGERGIIRLGSDSKLTVDSIDEENNKYTFDLEKGNLWGNNLYGKSSFSINTPYANLYSDNSSFSLIVDESKTTVYSEKYDTKVDIIADNKVINTLWIAEGNQAQLLHSKIDSEKEKIEKLLYSKLVKEFNYGRLNETKKKEDPWLAAQLQNDISYYNQLQSDYAQKINDKGLKTVSVGSIRSQAKTLLADVQNALTFNQSKKNEQIINSLFESVGDAEYLFLQGNDVEGNVRLSIFRDDLNQLLTSGDQQVKEILFDKISEKYYELSLFVPGQELFPVKQVMFEKLNEASLSQFISEDYRFTLLTAKLNDVYEAVDLSPVDLNTLFTEYFELYDKYTRSYQEKMSDIADNVIHQNILVDNLLFQTPELYKLEFFDQKKGMEADYLLALTSSNDKQEQRQTFISNDIDLLSRIRYFLFNEQLDAEDARQIVYRLIQDIESYQKENVNVAAVNELFNKRLADFGVFWEYLQATEYSSTQLHGASHSERFENFKKIQEEVLSYEDIRDEILGGEEVSQESIDEIVNNAKEELEEAGIQNIEFGTYEDLSRTKIPILSARAGGIEFRATYDWDRQLLSNIIVDNTVISQDGVKLSKAKKFITQTIAALSQAEEKETTTTVVTEEEDELAGVKRVASVFLADKFADMGMVITMDNVEVLDIDVGHYKVTDVYFSEEKSATFSFEYNTSDDKVSNLVVHTQNGDKSVDDTFTSRFINDVVLKIYDENK